MTFQQRYKTLLTIKTACVHTAEIGRRIKLKVSRYLGVSMDLGKVWAAGWLLGDRPLPPRPRAELYSNRGDWKAPWGCSGRGVSLSLTPIFPLLGRALDDDSISPVAKGSKTWWFFLRLRPKCLIRSGWFVDWVEIQKINILYTAYL